MSCAQLRFEARILRPAAGPSMRLLALLAMLLAPLAVVLSPHSAAAQAEDSPAAADVPAELPAPLSKAEQITRLERTIDDDEKRLQELREELVDPNNEYRMAEAAFKSIDERLNTRKAELPERIKAEPDRRAELESRLQNLEKGWALARERFDLAIQTRQTLQQQIVALENKIKQDRQALDRLAGTTSPPPAASEEPAPSAVAAPGAPSPTPATTVPTAPAPTAAAPASPAPTPAPAVPQLPSLAPSSPAASPVSMSAIPTAPTEPRVPSKALLEAEAQAQKKKQAADAAELEARSLTERLEALDSNIEIEQSLLAAARKKSDLADQSRKAVEQAYQQASIAEGERDKLPILADRVHDMEELFQAARTEVRTRTDRLNQLQSERAALQREALIALQTAKTRQDELDQAEEKLGKLKNPLAPHNILQWIFDHGPSLALIVGVMLALQTTIRLTTRRVVGLMVESSARGTKEEREDRAKTLVGVFQNAATVAIVVGGALTLCEEIGVAIGPLMGGAAVVGLAVAFGAQNLIRDYFYGFVILLENQYKINDVLRIGTVSGQVERITLRMTVLRDLEGCVHFIPNGKIDCVTNMTHGWSRAVFEIRISLRENADEVMEVLMELARELRRDPNFRALIIDDPEMLGVDAIGESWVNIKFLLKTRPLKQWQVKRELLRRIKRRFDELGIEIPMPHRMIYHRTEEDGAIPGVGRESEQRKKSA